MLNWAARYYPIVDILKANGLFESGTVLEIGSGSVGLGRFRKVPFIGCDLTFPMEPVWPMTPLVASAAHLPLKDKEVDVVLASDILEHIPPELRKAVITEALRVAGKLVIFGFPCGNAAWTADRELRDAYIQANRTPPGWLNEHMEAPFPEPELFDGIVGWEIERQDNENIAFRSWLLRREMSRVFVRASSMLMRIAPWLIRILLKRVHRAPFYRQIFTLRYIGND
ncbi:MAG: methyltransferase domain-containing protein [Acidobacteria bacterium]|nr:methyltransferase domain-containing protein [Acidobacteriota bacterium]